VAPGPRAAATAPRRSMEFFWPRGLLSMCGETLALRPQNTTH
jgi:hypothetical protein